jgi:hypothetical protein
MLTADTFLEAAVKVIRAHLNENWESPTAQHIDELPGRSGI